jgi:hypothetical protein
VHHPVTINCRGKASVGLNPNVFSPQHLKEVRKIIESWGLRPQSIFMSKSDFDDIKKWGEST